MSAENSRHDSPRDTAPITPDGCPLEGSRAGGTLGVASLPTPSVASSSARVASATDDGACDSMMPSPSGHRKQNGLSAASQPTSTQQGADPFRDDFACLAGGTTPESSLIRVRRKSKGKKSEPKEERKSSISSPQSRESIPTAATCPGPAFQDSRCEDRCASTSAMHATDDRGKVSEQQPMDADQENADYSSDQARIEKKVLQKKQVGEQKNEHRTHRPSLGFVSVATDADVMVTRCFEIARAEKECEEGISPSGSDPKPTVSSKDSPSSTVPEGSNSSERRPSKDGDTKMRKERSSVQRPKTLSVDFFGGSEEYSDNSLFETHKQLDRLAQISPEFSQLVLAKKMSLRKHSLCEHSGMAAKNSLPISARSELRSSPGTSRTPSRQPAALADTETRNQGTKPLGVSVERSRRGSRHADFKGGIVNEQEKHLPFSESGGPVKRTSSDDSPRQPGRSIHWSQAAVGSGRSEAKEDDKRPDEVSLGTRCSEFVDSCVERKEQGMNVSAPAFNEESFTPDEKQDTEEGVQSSFTFSPEFSDERKTSEQSDAVTLQVASALVRDGQIDTHSKTAPVSWNTASSPIKADETELPPSSTLPNETLRNSDVGSQPSAVSGMPHEKSLVADAARGTSQLETFSLERPERAPVETTDHEQELACRLAGSTAKRESSETVSMAETRDFGTSVPTCINAQLEIAPTILSLETVSAIRDRSEKLPEESFVFNPSLAPSVGMPPVGDRDEVTDSEAKIRTYKFEPSTSGFAGSPLSAFEFPDQLQSHSSCLAGTSLIVLELPDQDFEGEINKPSQGNEHRVCTASNGVPDDADNALEAEVKFMMGMDAGTPPAEADMPMEDFKTLTELDERAMPNLTMSSDIGALQDENAVGQNPHAPAADNSTVHTDARSSETMKNAPNHADEPTAQHAREVAVSSPTSTNGGQQPSQGGKDAAVADLTLVPPQDAPLAECTEASTAKSVLPKNNRGPKRRRHRSDAGTYRHSLCKSTTHHKRKKAHSFAARSPPRRDEERSLSVSPPSVSGTATGSQNVVRKGDDTDSAALFGVAAHKSTSQRRLWDELSAIMTQPVSVGVSVPAVREVVVLVDEHASPHVQVNHVLPAGSYANIEELDIAREYISVITKGSSR